MISDWLGIPAAIVAWGFALYVLVVAPPTRGARFLVAMLVVDGLAVITSYNNLLYLNPLLESVGLLRVPDVVHQVSDWALIAVYLPFLGMTLSSPLVAPLKNAVVSRLVLFGVLGTGALVFFLDPIQRAAEKLANAAMPNTVETPEYESFRKLQVYDSAVRAALEDGRISKRQRRVLDSMIESMGIDRNLAQRMEDDAFAAIAR